jgi:hypothetical protein
VAVVIDAFRRFLVGWQASRSLRTDLALDALEMAIWARRGDLEGWCITRTGAARADSIGRRNTLTVRSCDGSTETAVGHGGPVTDALTWSAAGGAA